MKALLLPMLAAFAGTQDVPPEMAAMAGGTGRETAFTMCSACHAIGLVTAQKLQRTRWDALFDWMTDKQGMPPLDPDIRAEILDYLAEHYGPRAAENRKTQRR